MGWGGKAGGGAWGEEDIEQTVEGTVMLEVGDGGSGLFLSIDSQDLGSRARR